MDNCQGFGIRIAETQNDRVRAESLLRELYGQRGYVLPQRQPHLGDCVTLIATNFERVVATMSLCTNSLPVEAVFPNEISTLRRRGARLCEIGRLAIEPAANLKAVFAALTHVIFLYAHYIHNKTDAIIQVNPRHANFYSRMLGFQPISDVRMNEVVKAPAKLLWISVDEMAIKIQELCESAMNAKRDKTLYPQFFTQPIATDILRKIIELGPMSTNPHPLVATN